MRFETRAIHAGAEVDEATGAIAPPLHLSTTFQRGTAGDTPLGYSYIRDSNPTQDRLEAALAAIDSGERALTFASGLAASTALMQSLPAGSHVLVPDDSYYGMRAVAREYFAKWQMTYDLIGMEDLDALRAAMRPETKLVWCESPSNPLLKVVDIASIVDIAHRGNALCAVDSTFAPPVIQRPIELGADLVMHSTTKYLGGHSDVQGGSLAFAKAGEWSAAVEHTRTILGGVASPFNSWLVLRGIRSLAARMRVHCENARAVAEFLAKHPRVEVVNYPGLPSHPRHRIAKQQMSDFGGMLSFLVKGGREDALRVAAGTRIFTRATSLGGTESLIEHRASSEGPTSTTAENLLRCSIGLENAADLIDDLAAALEV
jgi:cystathionine gamma-synthase